MFDATISWGMRVQVADRVGVYEGLFTAERPDLLRVRFTDEKGWTGVGAIERNKLQVIPEHRVCLHRRLKKSGEKPRRERHWPVPICYEKDYGKTALERATDAWLDADPDTEESRRLCEEMMRLTIAELKRAPPRRLRASDVASLRDPERLRTERWHRIRKGLRRQAQREREAILSAKADYASKSAKPQVSLFDFAPDGAQGGPNHG